MHNQFPKRRSRRTVGLVLCALLLVALGSGAAASAVPPPRPATGVSTAGVYGLRAAYAKDISATRGWQVSWRVPTVQNADAWAAVGQWYFNLETGIYLIPGAGWRVYYYGDDDGLTGNHPGCGTDWASGGLCNGLRVLPGQTVTFRYARCDAQRRTSVTGKRLCASVKVPGSAVWQFLASDVPTTVEMYSHDLETFTDSGPAFPEPVVPCAAPVVMLGQEVLSAGGVWHPLAGAGTWRFSDTSSTLSYRQKQLAVSPARWRACTG
jgi:hypothetical protein